MKDWTALHLFCGLGGGALGFQRAGFRSVGAFDYDAACCRDFETLTGEQATCADLGSMSPQELRDACTGRPHVVFSSPPCQGNSASLPASRAQEPHYQALNSLAYRGIWLALEAWSDNPPDLFVLENVPRITTRSRQWLDQLGAMLRGYGYAVRESYHDCGELGGLAQSRRRFLLVARRLDTVSDMLREPPTVPLKGIGEVVDALGLPHMLPRGKAGQSMHYLPRMKGMNWVRLALIGAGQDWRALPDRVALVHGVEHVGLHEKTSNTRHNGPLGVQGWNEAAHTVQASAGARGTWSSVADPRIVCSPQNGAYGVRGWSEEALCVIASQCHDNRPSTVADPRVTCARREGSMGVKGWQDPSTCIIGQGSHHNGPWQVADPRVAQTNGRFRGAFGIYTWDKAAGCITATPNPLTTRTSLADPRLGYTERRGGHKVCGWMEPSHTVIAEARVDKGFNVADPRIPQIAGPERIDLDATGYLVIRALDGCWHRPLTTAELGLLQGLPLLNDDGHLITLDGNSHTAWRRRIGNAVPPPSAEAIARECRATLEASGAGGWRLSNQAIWVEGDAPSQLEAGGAP